MCKFTFSDSQMLRQDEVSKDFTRGHACVKGTRVENGDGQESIQIVTFNDSQRREAEKVEAPTLPFSFGKVRESCQGILTKVTCQKGTGSLRLRSALVFLHHLATGREQSVGGGLWCKPMTDSRVQRLGPSVSYAPCSHRSARRMLMAYTTCQAGLSSSI
ncbi:hypothetical protein mRhiFer1_007972 [Rhinolophus ferrumequinum]|uniref:Uncharacterized protein n=1 Tax=Rhinolophus ferrumequinum TaxID=59479 RepID=A0A7J8AW43_RHIFE|nr:hypothetical protein mRhiFer1_007972 [Rhinolophus ferrumequinum]